MLTIQLIAGISILSSALFAQGPKISEAQAQIDAAIRAGRADRIGSVEVFRFPKNYHPIISVAPEHLERNWFYKVTIRDGPGREMIIAALRAVVVQGSSRTWDLRWGFIFYSKAEAKRIAAIYFDETGRHGSISEIPVSFDPDLFRQLKNAVHLSID